MSRGKLIAFAAVQLSLLPAMARAEELQFSYNQPASLDGPAGYFSFDLSSDPAPSSFSPPNPNGNGIVSYLAGNFTLPTLNWAGSVPDVGQITFYSAVPLPDSYLQFNTGFVAGPYQSFVAFGPVIYSGSENAPHFDVGTTSVSFYDGDGLGECCATVTIAPLAVPENATWAMMIAGFGLIGSAVRQFGKRPTGSKPVIA